MSRVHWLPLESNPEVITKFMHKIGVENGVECVDIFGFEDDLLAFIPRPCYAVLLCFPMVNKVDEIMKQIYEKMKEESVVPDGVFFMKQKISNACGTFALIHSLANNQDKINLGNGSLKQWLDKAVSLDVEERSDSLAENSTLAEAHDSCARDGETDSTTPVDHHFICYLNYGDKLLELDSGAPSPRICGSTSGATFLEDVGNSCKELMKKLESVSFSALAIVRVSH